MQERRKEIMRGLKGLPGGTLGWGAQQGWTCREGLGRSGGLSPFPVATFSQVSPGHQTGAGKLSPGVLQVTAGYVSEGCSVRHTQSEFFPFPVDLIKEVLSMDDEIQKLATELYHQKSVLIMGRGYHYATCLEGALVSFHLKLTQTQPQHSDLSNVWLQVQL